MSEPRHTIKQSHKDGVHMLEYEYWCGKTGDLMEWHFLDAQHVALAVGGSIAPCKKCIKAIIKELSKEL